LEIGNLVVYQYGTARFHDLARERRIPYFARNREKLGYPQTSADC
jgi:hypothetical protein